MVVDLNKLESEIAPLLEVHGVDLVSLEWLQGPGHGICRIYVDRKNGDPRNTDPEAQVTLTEVTQVTRDVSAALDALDLIEGHYTLEIGSPGPQRPVQKREDFDRFAGLEARIDPREKFAGRGHFSGVLAGTVDHPEGGFAVKIDVAGKVYEVPAARLARARLHEIAPPVIAKPGKAGTSRRQERLAAREQARAINSAHLLARTEPKPKPTTEAQQSPSPERSSSGADSARDSATPAGDSQRDDAHDAIDERNTPLPAKPGRATR